MASSVDLSVRGAEANRRKEVSKQNAKAEFWGRIRELVDESRGKLSPNEMHALFKQAAEDVTFLDGYDDATPSQNPSKKEQING